MDLNQVTVLAEGFFDRQALHGDGAVRPDARTLLLRHQHPTELQATLYEPVVCLILRGAKETALGDHAVRFGAGQFLLVSHEVPVVSQIVQATPEAPYLALILSLDLTLLRSLYDELGGVDLDSPDARTLDSQSADPALIDALGRYLDLCRDPVEARILGPACLREVHFRLLVAPRGGMLRRLLRHDSHEARVSRAIAQIREAFRDRIAVPELARSVGMSPSSFHQHFKAVTATTPLQYQKELRLLEARRLLGAEGAEVSETAYAVGYESPTQFSREYARKFGHPPSADRARA